MTTSGVSTSPSFTDTFYQSLMEIPEGERIKACLQCATCSGICPFGFLMDYPPGKMISVLRAKTFDQVLDTDSIWFCVSCYACTEVCPAKIPLTPGLITRTKEEMLLAGNIPAELQDALMNSQRYGNPLGESPRKRAAWAEGITPEVPILGKVKQPVDVLWFVGDYPSYHPRAQITTRSVAKIFNLLGVKFGILGREENSDGDSQRLAGERGLFEMLAEKNAAAFDNYDFNTIITTDPHAYNAIKNEYPLLGIDYPVQHYTEFLENQIEGIKPHLKNDLDIKVAYHDPCYLGRVNNIFDAPRNILASIPGVTLVEMSHTRTNSLCCGGGGGGMWLDGYQWEKAHVRMSEWRVREAVTSGADVLAVACPYEIPRFEDAAKMVQGAGRLAVKDIADLIIESIEG